MRGFDYNAIANLPVGQRTKSLAGAVAFEFAKPSMCLAINKHSAIAASQARVCGMDGKELTHEQIKSFVSQKYSTASDTPLLNDIAHQMADFFHTNMPEIDLGYELLFREVDLRGSSIDNFEILDTNLGITFNQREPGEEIKIRKKVTESILKVSYLTFSDGIGILDDWFRFQQHYKVTDVVEEFRANYYEKKASFHYSMFTALGAGIDESFATDDVKTANNAMASIVRNLKGKGYAISANSTFYILCEIEQVGRLSKMLTAMQGSAIVNAGTVDQPLMVRIGGIIGTTHIPAGSTGYYMVLPGHKIKKGEWQDLTTESNRNIYVKAEDITADAKWNSVIGEVNQVRRVKYA